MPKMGICVSPPGIGTYHGRLGPIAAGLGPITAQVEKIERGLLEAYSPNTENESKHVLASLRTKYLSRF